MTEQPIAFEPPRFENGKPLLISGLSERYTNETSSGIPAQWQRFGPRIGNIPGQIGWTSYGVLYNQDKTGGMDYLCGIEVSESSAVPADLTRLHVPERKYAVFSLGAHISKIRSLWHWIHQHWLPNSGHQQADAPTFERYGENFDPRTGLGDVDIWIPIE